MSYQPIQIANEMIRASAGAGKTYQLVNRYIRLLLSGQAPERIIALTFTRKAAGEFFAGILKKLAEAAQDAEKAKLLSSEIQMPKATPADFSVALRGLLDSMPQLALGTIDGFFNRVLGMFSLEYGLSGEFEIMDDFSAEQARLQVMEQLFAAKGARPEDREALIKSYQLVSAGKQDRRFYETFESYLRECHNLFHRNPRAEFWGAEEKIWPQGNPWSDAKQNKSDLIDEFRAGLEAQSGFNDRLQTAWANIVDHLEQWEPGKDLLGTGSVLLKSAIKSIADLETGTWQFTYYNKPFEPTPSFCQTLGCLLKHCLALEFALHLDRTRGVQRMLAEYDARYDGMVRRQGRLTFADLPMLLLPQEGLPILGGEGPDHLSLEYRQDRAFDHWLLDEFQDTSTAQWRVVENLIDEVVQDPGQARTFFCVGDTKQSIYGWRGGDPELFGRVERHYRAGIGEEIQIRPLDVSWRSAPPILEMVNRVFGSPELLAEFDKPAATKWKGIWNTHQPAEPLENRPGHALHLTVGDKADRFPVMAHLLEEIQPTQRGFKCAVLVQTNSAVRDVVDYLRANVKDLPVTGESATKPGTDNALSAALMSLLKAAAHPRDSYGREHVRMTPLVAHLPKDPAEWETAMRRFQEQLYREGFENVMREWSRHLEEDDFSRWRAVQFVELARQFDEMGLRDIDEFIGFAESRELSETTGPGVVQVMTIHKAKGLTFDVTLVPDLESNKLDSRRREALYAKEDDEGRIEWVLDLPKQDLCAADPVLNEAVKGGRTEACFENLCRLYVALTRAKHGLYVITTTPKEKNPSANYSLLLHKALGAGKEKFEGGDVKVTKAFEAGGMEWVNEVKIEAPPLPPEKPKAHAKGARDFPRLERRLPSAHDGKLIRGSSLFDGRAAKAMRFGSAVHTVFECIEWWDDEAKAKVELLCESEPEAVEAVEKCLQTKEIAAFFQNDGDGAAVWRERAFELVMEGEICSGVFDRVIVREGHAEVIDFKTDRVKSEEDIAEAVERHRGQLEWYRRVLVQLTGLPEAQITCRLLFTHPRRVVTL